MEDMTAPAPVPAPWTLRGDAHVLLARAPRRATARLGARVSLNAGGLGVLAFIRYTESNVGAYDELLWLSPWALRVGHARLHTVPRIYVSSAASLHDGRRNWGFPKELASFEVDEARGTERVRVTGTTGTIAAFEVATGGRSLAVDAGRWPGALLALGQVLDGRLFRTRPRVRGRLHGARSSRLSSSAELVGLMPASGLAALSLLDFTLVFPPAEVVELGPARDGEA
jgi:hypothetical protein